MPSRKRKTQLRPSHWYLHWIPSGETGDLALRASPIEDVEEVRQCLLIRRDRACIAGALAVVFSSFGLLLYEVRRPRINIVTVFTIVLGMLSAIGLYGVLTLNTWKMALDVILGAALSMAICVNLLVQTIFEVEENMPVPLPVMLVALLIPYLIVFVCKLFITHLALTKLELERVVDEQEESEDELSEAVLIQQAQNLQGQNVCAICTVNACTHAFVPCGHKTICSTCVDRLRRHGIRTCPLCRRTYTQVIQVFGS